MPGFQYDELWRCLLVARCVETVWALWGTVGELWELFEVGLRLGSGGTTLGKGKFGV